MNMPPRKALAENVRAPEMFEGTLDVPSVRGATCGDQFRVVGVSQVPRHRVVSNVRVEQRAAVYWMLALYPSRVCSNAMSRGSLTFCLAF